VAYGFDTAGFGEPPRIRFQFKISKIATSLCDKQAGNTVKDPPGNLSASPRLDDFTSELQAEYAFGFRGADSWRRITVSDSYSFRHPKI
jgi:hypothetical protein